MSRHAVHATTVTVVALSLAVLSSPIQAQDSSRSTAPDPLDERFTRALMLADAEQGDAHAQIALGMIYALGLGVPQDEREAVRWFRRAAEQGHAIAQDALGDRYANGRGVPQDYEEAVRWYPPRRRPRPRLRAGRPRRQLRPRPGRAAG